MPLTAPTHTSHFALSYDSPGEISLREQLSPPFYAWAYISARPDHLEKFANFLGQMHWVAFAIENRVVIFFPNFNAQFLI